MVMRPSVFVQEHIDDSYQTNLFRLIPWPNPYFPLAILRGIPHSLLLPVEFLLMPLETKLVLQINHMKDVQSSKGSQEPSTRSRPWPKKMAILEYHLAFISGWTAQRDSD